MALSYYIENSNRLWIKDNFAPFGTNIYYLEKISGYTPNINNIFDVADNFDDNVIGSFWTSHGAGIIEEVGGLLHIQANTTNGFPSIYTSVNNPIKLNNQVLEIKFKANSQASESCTIAYNSSYFDTDTVTAWYVFVDAATNCVRLYTKINNSYQSRWKSTLTITNNVWYMYKLFHVNDTITVQILDANYNILETSPAYSYDNHDKNTIHIQCRTNGDNSYFDDFKLYTYYPNNSDISIIPEGSAYKIKIHNLNSYEVRNMQIPIIATTIGSITNTTSLNITNVYREPLKKQYESFYSGCILDISGLYRDLTNLHTLTAYDITRSSNRFNVNNAAMLNGTSSRCVIPNTSDLNLFNLSTFTIILWIKQLSSYTSTSATIISKAANLNSNRWSLEIINNGVVFYIRDADSYIDFSTLSNQLTINDNNWNMISFVKNGNTVYLYKNGILFKNVALTNITPFTNTADVTIGFRYTGLFDQYLNANIDEFLIFNTAFNYGQMLKYYDLTKNKHIYKLEHCGVI